MIHSRIYITVFEHETIVVGQKWGENEFTIGAFETLERYHSVIQGRYYSIGYKKITFCEYVGVIQIGKLLIEILPKADNKLKDSKDKEKWKKMLISMLRTVGFFNIHAPTSTSLRIKNNSILDLYFELFISEIEYLLHLGLIKKYRKTEGNSNTLKGNLIFNKHIQQNLVHQERSFIKYTVYDVQHLLHSVLYMAIKLLDQINTLPVLKSRIGVLLLHFPELAELKVTEATFEKLSFSRKTSHYQKAIEIARLLLLNYHPDISRGGNHVLALMFDMNLLWEQFILESLRKGFNFKQDQITISGQLSKYFWKPFNGSRTSMRPDIVIQFNEQTSIVLDTKWKNLNGLNPSPEDLRQMFVYHHYYSAAKVALIYPGFEETRLGKYFDSAGNESEMECCLIGIEPEENISKWQNDIFLRIENWIHHRIEIESEEIL